MNKKIYNYALEKLARRDHSSYELRLKMTKKFKESNGDIDEIIDHLKQKKYLDDDRYAKRLAEIEMLKGKSGKRMIKLKLINKGIKSETAEEILKDSMEDFVPVIRDLMRRKFKVNFKKDEVIDANFKAKIARYLAGRGFDFEDIKKALKMD